MSLADGLMHVRVQRGQRRTNVLQNQEGLSLSTLPSTRVMYLAWNM